jgi:uncharacterized membrane protein
VDRDLRLRNRRQSPEAPALNPTSVYWTVALFFGCTIVFAAIHRLTQHQSTGVQILAQFAALGLIVLAVVLYVRSRDDGDNT